MKNSYYLDELRKIQKEIAKKALIENKFEHSIETVGGIDLGYLRNNFESIIAAGVVLDYKTMEIIEKEFLIQKVNFPYIPTLLAFRESPSTINLIKKLKHGPDILILNGHGIAHPLYCGYATHVGVLTGKPTIGVAKKILCGKYSHEPSKKGDVEPIFLKGRKIGFLYLSKKNTRPIVVSPGHLVSLETSLEIIKKCTYNFKFPEPLRLAHNFANEIKREIKKSKLFKR